MTEKKNYRTGKVKFYQRVEVQTPFALELTDEMIKQVIKEIRLYEFQKRMVEWSLIYDRQVFGCLKYTPKQLTF